MIWNYSLRFGEHELEQKWYINTLNHNDHKVIYYVEKGVGQRKIGIVSNSNHVGCDLHFLHLILHCIPFYRF